MLNHWMHKLVITWSHHHRWRKYQQLLTLASSDFPAMILPKRVFSMMSFREKLVISTPSCDDHFSLMELPDPNFFDHSCSSEVGEQFPPKDCSKWSCLGQVYWLPFFGAKFPQDLCGPAKYLRDLDTKRYKSHTFQKPSCVVAIFHNALPQTEENQLLKKMNNSIKFCHAARKSSLPKKVTIPFYIVESRVVFEPKKTSSSPRRNRPKNQV